MQDRIRAASERANEALRGDVLADAVERLEALQARRDLLLGGRPATELLRPAVFPREVVLRARERAAAVTRVLSAIVSTSLRSPATAVRGGFPSDYTFLMNLDAGAPSARVMGRIDGFFDESGEYRVLEYNAGAVGGMYETDQI